MTGQKIAAYLYFSAAAILVFVVADIIGKKALLENFPVLLACFMGLTIVVVVIIRKILPKDSIKRIRAGK